MKTKTIRRVERTTTITKTATGEISKTVETITSSDDLSEEDVKRMREIAARPSGSFIDEFFSKDFFSKFPDFSKDFFSKFPDFFKVP